MTTTKSDLAVIQSSDLITFANGEGNTVDADLVNQNFATYLGFLQTVTNFLIDQSPQTAEATNYSALQTFLAGLKTDTITASTSPDASITLIPNGTGTLYKTSATVANELYTKQQVDTAIAALTGTNYDLLNGGVKTADFTAVISTLYFIDVTSNDISVALPASPSANTVVGLINYNDTLRSTGNVVNIYTTDGENIQNEASPIGNPQIITDFYAIYLQFDSTLGWVRL